MGRRLLALAAIATLIGTSPALPAASDRLVLLDGSVRQGTVEAIDDTGRVHLAGGAKPVPLDGLRRIVRREAPETPDEPSPCALFPAAGGVLRSRDVTFDGKTFTMTWAYGKAQRLPLAAVRAVRLARAAEDDAAAGREFEAARTAAEGRRDSLFALVDGRAEVVRGALVAVEPAHVRFLWNEAERRIAREKVYGVVLARSAAPPERTGRCLVHLEDGSRAWMMVRRLENGRLHGAVADGADLSVPWSALVRLDVRSPRLVFLSDLDPVEAEETALITYAGPWRRDRNVVGGPLSLGGRGYEKGLGVHSRCRLVYDLGEHYDTFAATIGIDDSADDRGDCVFLVETDGTQRFRKRMTGAAKPHAIRIPVAGARRLALTVDWGDDLDLADRADWCDARLLTVPPE
ncbi:MAG: NPCBM/NEW2 domain-containing protein [Phycisphaerae bacterium]